MLVQEMMATVQENPVAELLGYNPETTQGNIIRAFGTKRSVYLFLRFLDRDLARTRLAEILPEYVTSALDQCEKQRRGETLGAFGLSWKGYELLGLGKYFPKGHDNDLAWFKAGPEGTSSSATYQLRWRPHTEKWEQRYLDNPAHAVLMLASNDKRELQRTARAFKKRMNGVCQIVAHEDTFRKVWKFHDTAKPAEHFGHRDGITTNPQPEQALVEEEPLGRGGQGATKGSFLAVLKLEQNPYKFRKDAQTLANKFREECAQSTLTWEDAQAMAVGRRQDGEPLVSRPAHALSPEGEGQARYDHLRDFNYDRDGKGEECPLHAHVRTMNKRRGDGSGAANKIVRRGMSYGPERQDFAGDFDQLPPSEGVGLMFTSYQANIMSLLTLLHIANDPKRLDATIGQTGAESSSAALCATDAAKPTPQKWKAGGCEVEMLMADFVTLRGGGYFFAPSLTLLREMKDL